MLQDFKYYNYSLLKTIFEIIFNRNSSAVFLYRLSRFFYIKGIKSLAYLTSQLNIILNSCDISYRANIGKGFKIFHSIGVVIGSIEAGENLQIYSNITIGANHRIDKNGNQFPSLGDNVTLYSGALIAGPIIIGDNTKIGANATLFKDVPKNTVVKTAKSIIETD